jgi:hypothetical protein
MAAASSGKSRAGAWPGGARDGREGRRDARSEGEATDAAQHGDRREAFGDQRHPPIVLPTRLTERTCLF